MRTSRLTPTILAAATFMLIGALAAPPAPAQPTSLPLAAPLAYKPVPIKLPQPIKEAGFEAFLKQLAGIAAKKDRPALARIVAQGFFWVPEDKDVADKKKPAIENLSTALGLEDRDGPGWDLLTGYAAEPTGGAHPERKGVFCAPGEPAFDDKAAEELATATQTDPSEWGYPTVDGIEVRSGPEPTSAVVEKLGLHLVRAYPDDSPASAVHGDMIRIVTPSGKLGFISLDLLSPLVSEQLCYVKEGNAWKIAGVIGGNVVPGQ
ncbi:MAG: hypothetical protein QOI12_3419 [Alphaproteobacteria bacterium]|jgi:hypothetical protein|nr:hypothetical protein [Alphaproteobacteria bacterium]